jgi:hypothetical protein
LTRKTRKLSRQLVDRLSRLVWRSSEELTKCDFSAVLLPSFLESPPVPKTPRQPMLDLLKSRRRRRKKVEESSRSPRRSWMRKRRIDSGERG